MKLGVIAEPDRANDSPDTVVVVEPSIGSVARSKGHLYLIVTSTMATARAQEATQLAAETIRGEYYYDESAGIRVCIEKAIGAANKRLTHQRERLGLHGPDDNGPIGIGIAVVRANELYVATIGPAEAYLIRQARLSTLPDPHRERGLPTTGLEPDVWRGEVTVGDSLVLVSPNVMSRLGPDELKDAMVTLHPQPAMEHLHHRFIAAGGTGSDAMIAFEATEVASTHKARSLVPVRPAEPLAGAPDRSPIPLADNVSDGVAAVQASAVRARTAAGSVFANLVLRLQDLLPRRRTAYRRVTPAAAKRETQRRAAVAVLSFVAVMVTLGTVVWVYGGQGRGEALSSINAGTAALQTAQANLGQVFAPGVDLIEGDPPKALQLLTGAIEALDTADRAGVPASTLDPLRKQAVAGLDRYYDVVPVNSALILSFAGSKTPFDIGAMVVGPDNVPYVLDRATKAVYRIDPRTKKAVAIFREGSKAAGATEAAPKLIVAGGARENLPARDLVIIDAKNVFWRWNSSDKKGGGTTTRPQIQSSAQWGDDITAIGTFAKTSTGLYNLYIVDPSEKNIRSYAPRADGTGYTAVSPWLSVERDVTAMGAIYLDGDLYAADGGALVRFNSGKTDGWTAADPGDTLLRPAPKYSLIAASSGQREGLVYAYDKANARIIAIDKAKGTFVEQYRLAGGVTGWEDLRAFYVVPGPTPDAPTTMIWATKDAVMSTTLEAVPDVPPPSPSPSAAPSGSAKPAPSKSG
jgi:hypothetical protein